MYRRDSIDRLVSFMAAQDGIGDKRRLAQRTQAEFGLINDRSIFHCNDFAIRFCQTKGHAFGNTVLALSRLQKYDGRPFIVCQVTPDKNCLMLANATFLRKISQTSQKLRVDNIKGSFNGTDIMRTFEGVENEPGNFEFLYASHEKHTFAENLERLVQATSSIQPTGKRFEPTPTQAANILNSIERARAFLDSEQYDILEQDLRKRVEAAAPEIALAASIGNVNLRGRIIEYLVTSEDDRRGDLVKALHAGELIPEIFTADGLGDYRRGFETFDTEGDIKTKMLSLSSNPKGYNIDKLLSFLCNPKSVYLIFVVAIDARGCITTRLCSMYNRQILNGTRILELWAGRNSRGVTQIDGSALESAVFDFDRDIDEAMAECFIRSCLDA